MANRLHNCINQEARSLAIGGRRRMPLLILAVVGAVTVEEIQAEKLLGTVEELLNKPGKLRLNCHFEDVKVLVGAQFLVSIVLVSCHLL